MVSCCCLPAAVQQIVHIVGAGNDTPVQALGAAGTSGITCIVRVFSRCLRRQHLLTWLHNHFKRQHDCHNTSYKFLPGE